MSLEKEKNDLFLKKTKERFDCVRKAHKTENNEDYVEMISDLINENGEARVVDLAKCFGVSQPTVNKTILRLQKEGLVHSKPYRSIMLTKAGLELALYCKKRHEIVLNFLLSLKVPLEIAELDAEGIEHHISSKTLEIFKDFTNNLEKLD